VSGVLCGPSSFHPYECDGASGGCVHCLRTDTETHDPGVCPLCDPAYDYAPNKFWLRRKRRRAKG
jgi:hypothetical protein